MKGSRLRVRLVTAIAAASMLAFGGGTVAAQSRVVGGTAAPVGSWPAMAEVQFSEFLCGGTLIDPSWVLTAAHCTFDDANAPFAASAFAIRLGITNRVTLEPTLETRSVDGVVRTAGGTSDDVALLHLMTPAVLGPAVATMDLVGPTDRNLWAAGAPAEIAGWGLLSSGATTLPSVLQQASLPIISDTACAVLWGNLFVASKTVCAGLLNTGGIGSCQGDSGGPLAVNNPAGGRALVGATSFGGAICGSPFSQTVYTRLDSYRDFIYGQVGVVVPSPPTGLRVTLANGSATVNWTPPALNGGRPVTGYRIRTMAGGVTVASTVAGWNATSVTLTGTSAPAGATFAVAAANARGFSTDAVASPPPPPPPPPRAPFYLPLSQKQAKAKAINYTTRRFRAKHQTVTCARVIDPVSTMRCRVSWKATSGKRIRKILLIYRTRKGIGIGYVRNG